MKSSNIASTTAGTALHRRRRRRRRRRVPARTTRNRGPSTAIGWRTSSSCASRSIPRNSFDTPGNEKENERPNKISFFFYVFTYDTVESHEKCTDERHRFLNRLICKEKFHFSTNLRWFEVAVSVINVVI